ncbi:AAA family ATPase [Xylophilus rhododendri]|uniref:non-specific serine/threonine protein kinase n=1 Tax=Xylophilus rhododendri TaxID=2697032 RepID=A0A857J1J3_9BURK|nr:ATPase domain-containing protein [Xylophilus rhododendri]QHI96745.1 AAA family ATPase [Xylophilus rhododendri]
MSSFPAADEASVEQKSLTRLPTGNAELDTILFGGFPAHSINILMGEPGSGKTILAERLMFANAEDEGRPVLFFTTLSEPVDKVVRYLQQFRFYDESKLGTVIQYSSIGQQLAEQGVGALVDIIKEAIIDLQPQIIVIDSFKAIHDLSTSVPEMRKMLYEVAGLLTAYETTAFFVGEYSADQISTYPEFAVADSMIELARNKHGTRDERFLRVLKLRGSAYLEGLHGFRITDDGLVVYPRLVSPATPPAYDLLTERVPTGVNGLDALLDGGLRRGRSTFVLGQTGAGKTTLAMQFAIEGIRRGEPSMYVSFEENPTQLEVQLAAFGLDAGQAHEQGLNILYVSPVELQIDSIVATVYSTVKKSGVKRIAIDAVGDLMMATTDTQRLHSYLYALAQHFAVEGVSSVFTYETVGKDLFTETRMSALADNILLLSIQFEGRRAQRTLRIVKARGIAHDLDEHELTITASGIEVG